MFTMRSRRITPKMFILPILLIACFCAIAVFDYTRQHVHVRMLGQSFDVSKIQQVLIEPNAITAGTQEKYYTLTSQSDILNFCQLLTNAKPYNGNQGDFATDIDSLLIQTDSGTLRIPIAQTSTNVILLFLDSQAYVAPKHFLSELQNLATSADHGK